MNLACRFALLTVLFAASVASAQSRGGTQGAKDAIEPLPDYSFCVSRFTAEGLKKEVFYTNIAKTLDKASMKKYLEDFAWSGNNSMLQGLASVSTECATFHSIDEATSARDRMTSAASIAGYSMMSEFKY